MKLLTQICTRLDVGFADPVCVQDGGYLRHETFNRQVDVGRERSFFYTSLEDIFENFKGY